MILTSEANRETIVKIADDIGISYSYRNGTIRIHADGLSDENVSRRLKEDHGIDNIID